MSDCRCAELEKEVAALKEKIHHLDDMLKSQQRKIRLMIEQVFPLVETNTQEANKEESSCSCCSC